MVGGMTTTDPLNDALREATLAVLLGSTEIAQQTVRIDMNGNPQYGAGIVTIPSAFGQRIASKAHAGEFDGLIREAMDKITPDDLVEVIKDQIAAKFLTGLEPVSGGYGQPNKPNWLQAKAREIAVEACTAALAADEGLLDTLRAKIGAEVDRNHSGSPSASQTQSDERSGGAAAEMEAGGHRSHRRVGEGP